mmetsp:Transcript_5242/g.10074  ORF Transcript_5242/g.10074 Transcript_5242/m.10074 type:complete len:372 (+) Transcript_5242:490-1605(+)|eukprot:scaffold482_cov266-Amphora_coffeaeformis.AAC.63
MKTPFLVSFLFLLARQREAKAAEWTSLTYSSLIDVLSSEKDLTTFTDLIRGLGQYWKESYFGDETEYTLFAPTDAAFEEEYDSKYFSSEKWDQHLSQTFLDHINRSILLEEDFEDGGSITTSLADPVQEEFRTFVSEENGEITIRGPDDRFVSTILDSDLTARYGVIYKVDGVFLPLTLTTSHLDYVRNNDRFSQQMKELVNVAGIEKTLTQEDLTLLAPRSDLPRGVFESIKNNSCAATKLWSIHLVNELVQYISSGEYETFSDETLFIRIQQPTYYPYYRPGSSYVEYGNNHTDISTSSKLTSNGFIYEIDEPLIPIDLFNDTTCSEPVDDDGNEAEDTSKAAPLCWIHGCVSAQASMVVLVTAIFIST